MSDRRTGRGMRRALGAAAALTLGGVLAAGAAGCHGAAAEGEPYRTVAGGRVDRGRAAVGKYGCGACHMIPGIRAAVGTVGPPLTAFGRRANIGGEAPNEPDMLVQWLRNPQSIEPGTAMPNLGVTERDARDMAAYLYTLR
ncbi:hypothetical protein tb265_48130 [Gemmatimonadetes bacterium T265]|nr:hypothetical protein tb265_48130 [Gemmatimonadetes bacterium T265]